MKKMVDGQNLQNHEQTTVEWKTFEQKKTLKIRTIGEIVTLS